MATFDNDIDVFQRLDFKTLRDGAICMYHDSNLLDSDIGWYKKEKYLIADIDTTDWTIEKAHKDLKQKLNFPDYYGENLAAFNDCLSDTDTTGNAGQVIVFRHFDRLAKKEKDFCTALLDIIAGQSRQLMLTGQRLIGLLQSDDPNLSFDKVGGSEPTWNGHEWYTANRQKKTVDRHSPADETPASPLTVLSGDGPP